MTPDYTAIVQLHSVEEHDPLPELPEHCDSRFYCRSTLIQYQNACSTARAYIVPERYDSRVLHCRSIVTPEYCTAGAYLRSAGAYIYCRIAHTQCRSAVTPDSTVRAYDPLPEHMIHCQSAHGYCRSRHRQCRSTVTPECCSAEVHIYRGALT
ncbi:hypothetical protein AMTR_s00081p00064340 [Amborella trichopoda]|uniref:Uncharacterized protein n=1 Tax=Amborella trichopoda TaxID=13333 RepID=W1P3N5_AMBTC|nr:hypothetical protein AMTR_s00081p00064340 [Amborella trichopoda]